MSKIPRRQILVDRSFQLSFLRLWLGVGLGLIVLSAVFYLLARQLLGSRQMDPIILRVILGMGAFILLFSALMGTLSVALAHRVAGAAYRLEKTLDRMLEGELGEPVALRKGDYLTRVAERIGRLQERLRRDRTTVEQIVTTLTALRAGLAVSEQATVDQLIRDTKSLGCV